MVKFFPFTDCTASQSKAAYSSRSTLGSTRTTTLWTTKTTPGLIAASSVRPCRAFGSYRAYEEGSVRGRLLLPFHFCASHVTVCSGDFTSPSFFLRLQDLSVQNRPPCRYGDIKSPLRLKRATHDRGRTRDTKAVSRLPAPTSGMSPTSD